ncbi:MAG TPA: response regulator, partial [Solirubrobacteraceae bacterium]|nr:response regulator [Solirubrobacteraceae bacterium]
YRARAGSPPIARPVAAAAVPSPSAPRVLVAEDNDVNQFAAIRLLQSFGFIVEVASNGREAITKTGRHHYDAVFMDCQMPDVDGYTAARVIRRREEHTGQHTPIIALTAHALEGDRQKCLNAGMDDYVAKPLRMETIHTLLERIPGLDRRRRPVPAPPRVELFDPAPLSEIGDPQTESMLISMFIEQASERLPVLLTAIESGDGDTLRAVAHGLKGSAATVGAGKMSELSRRLCDLAQTGITPAAADLHTQLTEALDETRSAMGAWVGAAG